MTDSWSQIGKYIKGFTKNANLAIKRTYQTDPTVDRIRDVFDSLYPFRGTIRVPPKVGQVILDVNFGKRLPAIGCCGDCICGTTESYTSDSLVSSNIYLNNQYVSNSTVVYLDGVRAIRNTDYIESNSSLHQLEILIPFSIITISYTYSTEGCTDELCINSRLPCLPDTYYGGLAVVFSDRFDRNESITTTGGCGIWYTSFNSSTGAYTPASFGNEGEGINIVGTANAFVGGVSRVSGKQFEILIAVSNISTTCALAASNGYQSCGFSLTSLGSGNYTLTVNGNVYAYDTTYAYSFGDIIAPTETVIDTVSNNTTISIPPDVPYYVRFVQMIDGWGVKFWPQDESESGFALTVTTADYFNTSYDTKDICLLTLDRINLTGGLWYLQAIRVNAGLDTGTWGVEDVGGYEGHICTVNPDGKVRFQHCSVDTISSNPVGIAWPTTEMSWSFSHFDSGLPGALLSYNEKVTEWNMIQGNPSGIRVEGYLYSDPYDGPITIPVEVAVFNFDGVNTPNFNGRAGYSGSIVASYNIPTDALLHPVSFVLPTNNSQSIFWGIKIASPENIPPTLPFVAGPALQPNNHGVEISFKVTRVTALASPLCTAEDYCTDGCVETRCADILDLFDRESTDFSGVNSEQDFPITGGTVHVDQGIDTRLTYTNGELTVDFSSDDGYVQNIYPTPFGCWVGNQGLSGEITFDIKMNFVSVGAGAEISFFGDFGPFIGWGTWSGISQPLSFGVSDPPPITENTWWSIRWQNYDDGTTKLRAWPFGTGEPLTWDIDEVSSEGPIIGQLSVFMEPYNGTTSFIGSIRNFQVRSL